MNLKLALAFLAALFFSISVLAQETSCVTLQIAVVDGEQETTIAGVTVLDMGSNEIVQTDQTGNATFQQKYAPGTEHLFQLYAPGYPDTYRTITLPGLEPGGSCSGGAITTFTFSISSDRLYLSPPIGPRGGEKMIWHPSGEMLFADESYTDIPEEYLQRIKIVVPPGVFSHQYRIGLTPFRDSAFNNAFMETFTTNPVMQLAQFRINLYDLDGNLVPSPTFAAPIRIEIAPATLTPWTNVEAGIGLSFLHFDETNLSWDQSGIVDSGLLLDKGSAFVEIEHFSVYSMCALEPPAPECWWDLVASYDRPCASPNGAVLDTNPVVCGVGGQGHQPICVSQGDTMSLDTSNGAELSADMANKVRAAGFHVSIAATNSKRVSFEKTVAVCRSMPNGSDPITYGVDVPVFDSDGNPVVDANGDPIMERKPGSGTAKMRELMTTWIWEMYCSNTQGVQDTKLHTRPTGLCIDTSGLVPCP